MIDKRANGTGKVTVLTENPTTSRIYELFPKGCDVVGLRRSDPGAAERLAETEVLISSGGLVIDRPLIEAMPNLKFVQSHGVGVDKTDVRLLWERGVLVANTQGHNAISVAEHAMMLALVLSRRFIGPYRGLKERGAWQGAGEEAWELAGKSVGILGFGYIGKAVARMAQGFDMRVIAWQRRPERPRPPEDGVEFFPLETVLRESDVLCIATPLSQQTRGLIGADQLALMKPTAIIVNVGRGPIIDQVALIDAVQSGRLAGAGLDVTTSEPLPPGHPLLGVDNIVVTPHYAGGARDSRARGRQYVYDNVARFLRGETPERLVTEDTL
ncbi:MAG TPA: 2-hydroxyacid dehydrogenase [Dehalococcoidia bacterium]|nr:2-hydroxyacid dehydrogenase [Dehalococcoidia bacterium]